MKAEGREDTEAEVDEERCREETVEDEEEMVDETDE